MLPSSCRTRDLRASCRSKRSLLFGERSCDAIAVPVVHRHVVFTIPRVLRGLFERERSLLGLLARPAYETVRRVLNAAGQGKDDASADAAPGFVASIQTFRSVANTPSVTSTCLRGPKFNLEGRGACQVHRGFEPTASSARGTARS